MLSSLTFNPRSLNAGAKTTCTVTSSGADPIGGTVVALASSSTLLNVPPSITVVAGSSSATFAATAGYGTKQRATITASFGGGSASVSIVIGRGNTWRQPPADKTAVKQVAMFGIRGSPFAPLIRSSFLNRVRVYSASSRATRKNSQAYLKKQGNNRTLGSREFIGPRFDVAVPSCPL
jgi:hypothetical protein